jgi:4-hydroxy-3-polyprenylbenzoate decarboxylase
LESAGIQDIAGVYNHTSYLTVVSIKQKYAGHAKQAGMAALSCAAANRNGRYVVVVDEDIDVTNVKEVLWAMMTRVDPPTNIDILDGCWSTPLDPAMHPDQRDAGNFVNSRAILNACRPYAWRDRFPPVNALSPELKKKMEEKWKKELE